MRRIESNLAREPFINRRAPVAIVAVLVAAAVLATLLNIGLFIVRGGEYRAHHATRNSQQERLAKLESTLAEENKLLEGQEVDQYAAEATFVSDLLARKRFSWTVLLDHLEEVKPYGVMLTDLRPQADREGRFTLKVRGAANTRAELLKFEENLLHTPRFRDPMLDAEDRDTSGPWTRFSLSAEYVPEDHP